MHYVPLSFLFTKETILDKFQHRFLVHEGDFIMACDKSNIDALISSKDSNEYFNSISHLIGTILAMAGLIVLVTFSALEYKSIHFISFAIYGITLFLSFLASTILHFHLLFNNYKRILGILDHNAIYLLIAGTYTPFCLVIIKGALGWVLFGIIWSFAIFCIAIKSIFFKNLPKFLSMASYLLLSWLFVFFVFYFYRLLGIVPLGLMLLSGLFYTVGALSFYFEKPNPHPIYFGHHEIWHVAVLLGAAGFYFVMLFFVLPA